MMRSAQIVLLSAARFYTPLIALFAFALPALYAPGAGVGFVVGLALALALALHMIVFGAAAARAAAPPLVARIAVTLGLIAAMGAAGAPGLALSGPLMEGGLFAATAGAASLILNALAGRAPSLRDEDW
jgi:hypothetical protein